GQPVAHVADGELHMSADSDATGAFAVDAPVVEGRDRDAEVVGQVLDAQQRLQAACGGSVGVHVGQVRTGSRANPRRYRSVHAIRLGTGLWRRPRRQSGGFVEGWSNPWNLSGPGNLDFPGLIRSGGRI